MPFPDDPLSHPPTGHADPQARLQAEVDRLAQSVGSLRFLLNTTLAVLIFVTATLNYLLATDLRAVRLQAAEVQRRAVSLQRVLQDYESNSVPVMQRFTFDLKRFADRNSDFAAILAKYPLFGTNAATNPAPVGVPVPAPAAQPPRTPPAAKK